MPHIIKLEPSESRGLTWTCTKPINSGYAFDDCQSEAHFGLSDHVKGQYRVQLCLAHALEWCFKNKQPFPYTTDELEGIEDDDEDDW